MKMLKLELSSNMSHPFPLLFSIMITTMITTRTSTTAVNDPAIAGTWFGANEKKTPVAVSFMKILQKIIHIFH